MNTQKGETISLIISIFIAVVLCILFAFAFASMQKEWYEEVDNFINLKAYCDSVGGKIGIDKCFVNGKEIKDGGIE